MACTPPSPTPFVSNRKCFIFVSTLSSAATWKAASSSTQLLSKNSACKAPLAHASHIFLTPMDEMSFVPNRSSRVCSVDRVSRSWAISKIGLVRGEFTPKKSLITRWDFLLNRSVYNVFSIDFACRCCAGQHGNFKCMENTLKKQQSEIQKSAIISFYNMFSIDFARQIGVPGCVQILLALEPKPMVNGGHPDARMPE